MGRVLSVSISRSHSFSKQRRDEIVLLQGIGVEGDAHSGKTVKHRSRVKADPSQPNLRQVHLIQMELIEELRENGFKVNPGTLGENITTVGINLLDLPRDTNLIIGGKTRLQITGLRNPCSQLDDYQQGLTAAVLDTDEHGNLIRKAGVMSIVTVGGVVRPDDAIDVVMPELPHHRLERV